MIWTFEKPKKWSTATTNMISGDKIISDNNTHIENNIY